LFLGVYIYNHRNKGANINWGTQNLGNSAGSNWVYIKIATTRANSNDIIFAIIAMATSNTKVVATKDERNT
jgi:hypothetical protein